jgi:pyruvate kinase
MTGIPETFTQLPLLRGVIPILTPKSDDTDDMLDRAVSSALELKIVAPGDIIVIVAVADHPAGVITRATNILLIARVTQD